MDAGEEDDTRLGLSVNVLDPKRRKLEKDAPEQEGDGLTSENVEALEKQQENEDEEIEDDEEYQEQPLSEEEIKEARQTLKHILQSYPRTIQKLDQWEVESKKEVNHRYAKFVRHTRRELQDL